MNFQQLRILQEATRRNFNLTEVANVLYTSQSGVSKHIKDLEDELGVAIFIRRGKRLLGLTEPGRELAKVAERLLLEAKNMRQIAAHFSQQDEGRLCIATTHAHARYALPPIVRKFRELFPKVDLELHQGSPREIVALLQTGEAEIGVATEAIQEAADLACFPFYQWHHCAIVPLTHPLLQKSRVTLADLAAYPLITYNQGFTGRPKIDAAFADAELTPNIVMTALDADVIKSYVELGLGVGLIAASAYEAERDTRLLKIDCDHLFAASTTWIAVQRGRFLRGFARRFLGLCSPGLSDEQIRQATAANTEET